MHSADDAFVLHFRLQPRLPFAQFYSYFFTIEFLKRYQIFLYSDVVRLPSYKKLTFQEQCVLI